MYLLLELPSLRIISHAIGCPSSWASLEAGNMDTCSQLTNLISLMILCQPEPLTISLVVQIGGPEFIRHLNTLRLYSMFTFILIPSELVFIQSMGRKEPC